MKASSEGWIALNSFLPKNPGPLLLANISEYFLQLQARIVCAHERFADKERMHLMLAHQLHILCSENAALGDHDTVTPVFG